MRKSWLPLPKDTHFPLENLPYGIFVPKTGGRPRAGMALGDYVIDLAALAALGHFEGIPGAQECSFAQETLNAFLASGRPTWRAVRERVQQLFSENEATLRPHASAVLHASAEVTMRLPIAPGDYVDFYASKEHASNVGRMFRDEKNPLLPNWVHIPIGYHGRAGSIVVSGTPVRRPSGQLKLPDSLIYGPTRELDFELEVAFVSGRATAQGTRLTPEEAEDAVFGFALFNDWSARDIQRWEYVPLGPFLGKSFASSLSPWLVTLDALEPFRVPGPAPDVEPLPYLVSRRPGLFDMRLEVWLKTAHCREPERIAATNLRHLYWSPFQQLAHMTSNGSPLRLGDVFATGTISGPEPGSYGSMLELAWKGTRPLRLESGEERAFLADGDEVILRGWCERNGLRVGLGEVRGTVVP